MKCENEKCRRQLTTNEPVYRCSVILHSGLRDERRATIHICRACVDTRTQWDSRARGPRRDRYSGYLYKPVTWQNPKLCEHCGRPVIQETSVATTITACSSSCREAIYNTNRSKLGQRFCCICGTTLSGNQRNYCSPAHKQAGYRARAKR
jgi:hypothetical protein